jgi:hypothetical protein
MIGSLRAAEPPYQPAAPARDGELSPPITP